MHRTVLTVLSANSGYKSSHSLSDGLKKCQYGRQPSDQVKHLDSESVCGPQSPCSFTQPRRWYLFYCAMAGRRLDVVCTVVRVPRMSRIFFVIDTQLPIVVFEPLRSPTLQSCTLLLCHGSVSFLYIGSHTILGCAVRAGHRTCIILPCR